MSIVMHFMLIILLSNCALHDIRKLFFLKKALYSDNFYMCTWRLQCRCDICYFGNTIAIIVNARIITFFKKIKIKSHYFDMFISTVL